MARWAPLKKDQLSALATEILHNYGHGRAIVAVDGAVGSGTAQFADDLAETFERAEHPVFRASIEDFLRPRVDRESEEALYAGGYDYSLLRRVLIEPFRSPSGTGFVLAGFDAERDVPLQSSWTSAGPDALLILDGRFLNRPELAGAWNYSIWVDGAQRSDSVADALYWDEVGPRTAAVAIIDNRDPDHPRRVFADSC
jgi:uridine kinase